MEETVAVFVPVLLRPLARGAISVQTRAGSVRRIVEELDRSYPGFAAAIGEGRVAFAIDGEFTPDWDAEVHPGSELHFVTAISGG
jgi:sulfur carrier protein ThiS